MILFEILLYFIWNKVDVLLLHAEDVFLVESKILNFLSYYDSWIINFKVNHFFYLNIITRISNHTVSWKLRIVVENLVRAGHAWFCHLYPANFHVELAVLWIESCCFDVTFQFTLIFNLLLKHSLIFADQHRFTATLVCLFVAYRRKCDMLMMIWISVSIDSNLQKYLVCRPFFRLHLMQPRCSKLISNLRVISLSSPVKCVVLELPTTEFI